MPIYEYECESCHRKFERFQKVSDPNPETCDWCGQGPVRKLISLSGFILKGSGYYTTENRSAARKAEQKADQSPPAEPAKPKAE
jgi:putative FmdB family regulatory protein